MSSEKNMLEDLHKFVIAKEGTPDCKVNRVMKDLGIVSRERAKDLVEIMIENQDFEMKNYSVAVLQNAANSCQQSSSLKMWLFNICGFCYESHPRENLVYFTCECFYCKKCFVTQWFPRRLTRKVDDWACDMCKIRKGRVYSRDELQDHLDHLHLLVMGMHELEAYRVEFVKKLAIYVASIDHHVVKCAWECGFSFIALDQEKCATCPNCKKPMCKDCGLKWQPSHKTLTCEEYVYKYFDDGSDFMRETGTMCPGCIRISDVAPGGCLHGVCGNCNVHFCTGCRSRFYNCDKPTREVTTCTVSAHKGVESHAHCPRNCASYLRDWDVKRLKKLLARGGSKDSYRDAKQFNAKGSSLTQCQVQIVVQNKDNKYIQCQCAKPQLEGGMCEEHFKLFLIRLINNQHLDPVELMTIDEMLQFMKTNYVAHIPVPGRQVKKWFSSSTMNDLEYTKLLRETIKRHQPLAKLGIGK